MNCAWIVEDDEMAFSLENQQLIKEEIAKAIRVAINPLSRTKRLLIGLKDWGLTALIWTVPLGLLAICVGLGLRVISDGKDDATFRSETKHDITDLKSGIKAINESLLALRIKAAISNPADPTSQAEVTTVLASAKKELIPLPLSVIQQGGERFVETAKSTPNVWGLALELISYRTDLNTESQPHGFGPLPRGMNWTYGPSAAEAMAPTPTLRYSAGEGVPSATAARLNRIGKDPNSGTPLGPLFLDMQGGAYRIDNQEIRNVFFRGVEVHYGGAPLILENVTFMNCTFVMDNDTNTRSLGKALLASTPVTFRAIA